MIYPEKVKILAKKNQPKPEEARYWVDLTADPYGGIWKVWNGLTWIRVFATSGSGGGIEEAPSDGNLYGRKNQVWQEIDIPDVSIYATKTEVQTVREYVQTEIDTKQDTLISGTNIKTINGTSLLGSGNITLETPEGGLSDAASDGKLYGRKDGTWSEIVIPDISGLATKSELSSKLDTETYNVDKATFALKTEIPDTSTFITTETADGKYQPKGTYLTEVPDGYVTDVELTEQLALKADASELSNYLTTASATSTYATKTDLDSKLDTSTYTSDKSTFVTTTQLSSKQDTLVSGTNIKTVNGVSILGSGNITIETPEGGIIDAPQDGKTYGRKDGQWSEITIPDTSALATKAEIADMATQTWVGEQGYLTEHQDISNLATKEELASKANTSDLSNYLTTTNASTTYETISGAQSKYQPVGEYALKSEIPSLSGYATESYVNTQISNLVNSAPEALNTLDELAAALNDDSNFATTVTNQIATKLDITTYTNDKETFALKTELSSKADSSALVNYLTTATAESTYAKKSEIPSVPTTVSSFTNDAGYITEVPSEYVKEDELKTINGSSIIGVGDISIEQDSFYTNSLNINQTTLSNGDYLDTLASTLYCAITSTGNYQIKFAKFGIGRVQSLIVKNEYSGSISIYFTSSEMDVKILNGENELQLDAGEILEVSCIQTQDNVGYIRWAKSVPTDPYSGYIGI